MQASILFSWYEEELKNCSLMKLSLTSLFSLSWYKFLMRMVHDGYDTGVELFLMCFSFAAQAIDSGICADLIEV